MTFIIVMPESCLSGYNESLAFLNSSVAFDIRDQSAKEASLKYKGGTMEQLEYVTVQNNLTEKRCFELVGEYMK